MKPYLIVTIRLQQAGPLIKSINCFEQVTLAQSRSRLCLGLSIASECAVQTLDACLPTLLMLAVVVSFEAVFSST